MGLRSNGYQLQRFEIFMASSMASPFIIGACTVSMRLIALKLVLNHLWYDLPSAIKFREYRMYFFFSYTCCSKIHAQYLNLQEAAHYISRTAGWNQYAISVTEPLCTIFISRISNKKDSNNTHRKIIRDDPAQ